MTKLDLPDDILVYEYVNEEKSTVELSKKYNCSYQTINRHLVKQNVKLRSPYYYSIDRINKATSHATGRIHSEESRRKNRDAHMGKKCPRTKEYCHKMSESRRGSNNPVWGLKFDFSDERRRQLSVARRGANNPAWKGGITERKYCFKFNNRFKERVREKFDRKCYLCPKTEHENGKRLDVHHIDYNKNSICNGKEWAFVPLCHSHHSATNNNRWYWFNLLIYYWAMNSEINMGEFI